MMGAVICSICADRGDKSILREYGCAVTDMGWYPYYDENGMRHSHNPNGVGYYLECSNGHEWWPNNTCPNCDYGKPPNEWRVSVSLT